MLYDDFNQFVIDKYFCQENIGSLVVLSVDKSVMQEFYREFNIKEKDLYSELKHRNENIWKIGSINSQTSPKMLGLVAIQIYVATEMHEDEEDGYSAQEYNPRLEELFGFTDLQTIYSKYQDIIWQNLYNWAKNNGFIVKIPAPTCGKGCYIQYPLSQALLNQEDFKYIPLMFKKDGLRLNESLSFKDFESIMMNSDSGNYLSNHYYKVKDKLSLVSKCSLLYSQIFTYYNNQWDGNYPKENIHLNEISESNAENYNLVVNEDVNKIEVFDKSGNIKKKISLEDRNLFNSLKEYYRFHKHLKRKLVFIKDVDYCDWCESRFLEKGKDCLIISIRQWGDEEFIKDLNCEFVDCSTKSHSIYRIKINAETNINEYWQDFFSKQERNVSIEYGLKLDRRVWMYGAGPTLFLKNNVDVWINGKKINDVSGSLIYSLRDLEVGSYRIKEREQSPIRFEIEHPKNKIIEIQSGWFLSENENSWKMTQDDYNFSGLICYFPQAQHRSSVRNWINSFKDKTNIKSTSVVINSVNRSRYGL